MALSKEKTDIINEIKKDILSGNIKDNIFMVESGPGGGKTSLFVALMEEINNLFADLKFKTLALTFSNQAKKEIIQRFGISDKTEISTIHGFCLKILRINKIKKMIIDDEESISIISNINLDDFDTLREISPKAIYEIIQKNRESLKELSNEILKIFEIYQEEKEKNNLMDFVDILEIVEQVCDTAKTDEFFHSSYQVVLVDEAQDISNLQLKILNLLLKDKLLILVGDEDQSIYGFRGSVDYIFSNKNLFEGKRIKKYQINENYRSIPSIVDYSIKLINNNSNHKEVPKIMPIMSSDNYDSGLFINKSKTELEEVKNIVDNIKNLIKINPDCSIAILNRRNNMPYSKDLEKHLFVENIKFIYYKNVSFFQRQEIKDILAYLKLAVNPCHVVAFQRIHNKPSWGIGHKLLTQILIDNSSNIIYEKMDKLSNEKYIKLTNILKNINEAHNNNVAFLDIIEYVLEETKIIDWMEKQKSYNDECRKNIEFFLQILKQNNNIDDIIMDSLIENNEDQNINVYINTYHASKGLEYDYVFLPCFEENIIPHKNKLFMSKSEIEEERRVAYVGVTRAKTGVFISYSDKRKHRQKQTFYYKKSDPSRFIKELDI